jgi:L-threonylcarbamoyladenylate synthase
MTTLLLGKGDLDKAARLLREGGLVAFPTETVYGLGARVFDDEAVRKIFHAKGRPSDNPLIVHCADMNDIEKISAPLPPEAAQFFQVLAARFFPGPLTVLLPKKLPLEAATAGLPTVAVRFPAHALAERLIRAVGEPLVAPSANASGYPSPTAANHVLRDMNGRIDAILDGGGCAIGLESTVVDFLSEPPIILRPGGITKEELDEAANSVGKPPFVYADDASVAGAASSSPPSPGMKYRHYAPNAEIFLAASLEEALGLAHEKSTAEQKKTRILQYRADLSRDNTQQQDNKQNTLLDEAFFSAPTLYAHLRKADDDRVHNLIIVCDNEARANAALMNRITKAASKR